MELESAILYQILNQFYSQLMQICNSLVGKSEEQLKQFWLVKQAAKSPSIYQLICDKLMKNHASFISKLVQSTASHCSVFKLYPIHEQPCVLLCQIPMDPCVEDLHVPKLMNELLALWGQRPESVVKLIHHFPCLIKWLTTYCDKNISAQRLSLHLLNYIEKI